ncbi:hypothetical protein OIDMADRAFT_20111 [Oidiodendron maius Zn]|uniref:Uncharacterized protein n=1 Tax=Oidiodendron maius (strain Zn) TaxID=913774 RepID=A0A0C3CHQ1_OIDMZ|nr:hypothetical protein OIDMADRAFT_20111 [Oidiodendron maius Zn]
MVLDETSKRGSSLLFGLSTRTNNGASCLPIRYASESFKDHCVAGVKEVAAVALS